MIEIYNPGQAEKMIHCVNFLPDWFIDAGPANGNEAHIFKKRWPTISVLGLEPGRASIEDALALIYPGILIQKAMWSSDCRKAIYKSDQSRSASLMRSEGSTSSDDVDCVTLATLSATYGPFTNAVLWLDVEGSEIDALEGGRNLILSGAIRLANVEVYDGGGSPEHEGQVNDWMKSVGMGLVLSYERNGFHHDNVYRRLA